MRAALILFADLLSVGPQPPARAGTFSWRTSFSSLSQKRAAEGIKRSMRAWGMVVAW